MLWVVLAVAVIGILGTVVIARGRVAARERPALGRAAPLTRATGIPAARVTARARPPASSSIPTRPPVRAVTPAKPAAARVPAPARPTVLVVDDSATMQRSLEGLFRQAGYSVVCAADGQLALAWVKSNGMPALITLDLEMPNLNGVETLQALQQLPSQAPVKAVFITGKGPRLRETSGELGAIGYFNKPYDRPALLALAARVAPLPA